MFNSQDMNIGTSLYKRCCICGKYLVDVIYIQQGTKFYCYDCYKKKVYGKPLHV